MSELQNVNWQQLNEKSELESGKLYLCSHTKNPKDDEIITTTYYEKGDIVHVRVDETIDFGKETAEKKLLAKIFGHIKNCAIPETGLYIITDKYGMIQNGEDEQYQYCTQRPVCIGNPVSETPCYFAPIPPDPDAKNETEETVPVDTIKQQQREELVANVNADPIMRECVKAMIQDTKPWDGEIEVPLNGLIYCIEADSVWYAVYDCWTIAKTLADTPKKERNETAAKAAKLIDAKVEDNTKYWKIINNFCNNHNIKTALNRHLTNLHLLYLAERNASFYAIREHMLNKKDAIWLSNIDVLQDAYAKSRIPARLSRVIKLIELKAPEIIMINELRLLAIQLLVVRNPGCEVHVLPNYTDIFSVDAYGNRGEIETCKALIGDEELFYAYKDPNEDPDDKTETEDANVVDIPIEPETSNTETEDNNPETDRTYVCLWAPNFMMRRGMGKCVIFNNLDHTYLRDENGEIRLFDDCPYEFLKELNNE